MKAPTLVFLVLIVSSGCAGDVDKLPPVVATRLRAVARGASAPDQAGLFRATLKHLAARPNPVASVGPPRLVCVDAWHIGSSDFFGSDEQLEAEVAGLAQSGVAIGIGKGACFDDQAEPVVLVGVHSPEQWWNAVEEYEVPLSLLYKAGRKGAACSQMLRIIAAHKESGWVVVREESGSRAE